jgi:hypothetical protein
MGIKQKFGLRSWKHREEGRHLGAELVETEFYDPVKRKIRSAISLSYHSKAGR